MISQIKEYLLCSECDKKGIETKINRSSVIEAFIKDQKTISCSNLHQIPLFKFAPEITVKKI